MDARAFIILVGMLAFVAPALVYSFKQRDWGLAAVVIFSSTCLTAMAFLPHEVLYF